MLSDEAAMLTGSLGMLPSASLGAADEKGKRHAMYEPCHGSAPDIAGKGIANPIAMIGSLGMALRYSFDLPKAADAIDAAIANVLAKGLRTADIKGDATLDRLNEGDGRRDRGGAEDDAVLEQAPRDLLPVHHAEEFLAGARVVADDAEQAARRQAASRWC